jgi:hypothetical protein
MRTLVQALHDHELIVLRVIGEWWEMDLTGADKATSVKALAETLAGLDLAAEISYLPPEEATALQELIAEKGRMPVATFGRKYGELRLMGPGRLEREEPWLDPVSPVEALWYRGLLYKGFDETAAGLVEFYYLPNELYGPFDASAAAAKPAAPGLPAQPSPEQHTAAAVDVVDDLTTILAVAQQEPLQEGSLEILNPFLLRRDPVRLSLLLNLARDMELLRPADQGLRPARVALAWLRRSREEQLREVAEAWRRCHWNELARTPGLACEENGRQNDPLLARQALFDALPRTDAWYAIGDLQLAVREHNPDFQRPDGNYDTWYIRDVASNVYLSGFADWDLVEGRLLAFLVQGPLCWLGLADTATDKAGNVLFRLTGRCLAWLAGEQPTADEVKVPLVVQDDASLVVPFNAGRYERFQAARISEAQPVTVGKPYLYHLTPRSLHQAREQNIAPDRVLIFLAESSGRPLPPSTKRAIERWAERGPEATMQSAVILRVRDAEILDKLSANPKTRSLLGERLADLAAVVRGEDAPKLQQLAARLGLLIDYTEP